MRAESVVWTFCNSNLTPGVSVSQDRTYIMIWPILSAVSWLFAEKPLRIRLDCTMSRR